MAVIARWECPKHGDTACFNSAANTPGWCMECEGPVKQVEYVPAEQLRGAVERAEKAEAELRKAEPVLVAADRIREAYEAMMEGRDVGRLADWTGGQ